MKWGCCGDGDRIRAIAQAGYDYVESPVRALRIGEPEESVRPFFDAVTESGVSVEGFNVFVSSDLPVVGPNVDQNALRRHVGAIVARVAGLNTSVIVLGSGGARAIPDGWDPNKARTQFKEFCSLAADAVAPAGITITIEPLVSTACNYIHTVAEALDIAREVNRPEVGALADLYHMQMNNDPISELSEVAGELKHVHLPVPNLPGLIEHDQTFDHLGYLSALKAGGYTGRISVEDNGKRFGDFDTEAKPVLEYLQDTWASL
jgi:D-psicose/D-tagatose/L-ribulose 3-epimerase